MKRLLALLTIVAAFSFTILPTGCGQSGPLYVPGNPSTISQPPATAESTIEEESEDNGDTEKE